MLPDTRRQRGCVTDKESRDETSLLARFFGDRLARDNNASLATAMIAESRFSAKTAAAAAAAASELARTRLRIGGALR
jgi:hypothetical protein